jgi:tetratricopeptide (TPR) repeat protein
VGHDRPRWRAKFRHRHDREQAPSTDPHESLAAWIDARGWASAALESLEALDLTEYLRGTSHIDLAATERLRKLAIAIEPCLRIADQPRGWLALERIYLAGLALDPDDAEIEISRAISADRCLPWGRGSSRVQHRILAAGHQAAAHALALRPNDARAHCAAGMLHYSFAHDSIVAALRCFVEAVALDPSFGWARLYRAHCLHDLGRWAEAAVAYSDVDPAFFEGNRAWRYDLLREQRAFCLLQAGDHEQALAEFLAILERYEKQPVLTRYQLLQELRAAAEGPFRPQLAERLARLDRCGDGGAVQDEPTED